VVKEGDLLAEIDPRPYQRSSRSRGQMARDQALLANALIDVERLSHHVTPRTRSPSSRWTRRRRWRQYEARSNSTRADRQRQAPADLCTHHRANLRGWACAWSTGHIVRAGDANGLVVITQLQR